MSCSCHPGYSEQRNTPHGFGVVRFGPLALLTLIEVPGSASCGVVTTKFSGHVVTLRSSPTVFADTPTSRSASTCIVSGKPPRAPWSAAMHLGLYRIWAPSCVQGTRLVTGATSVKTGRATHAISIPIVGACHHIANPPMETDMKAMIQQERNARS